MRHRILCALLGIIMTQSAFAASIENPHLRLICSEQNANRPIVQATVSARSVQVHSLRYSPIKPRRCY
jgi:hypothetical protein